MSDLTPESEKFLERLHERMHDEECDCVATFIRAPLAAIEAAAAARATAPLLAERDALRAVAARFMETFEETGVHEHERDDDSIDLCIPIAPLKPVYWAACAALGHRWTVVDVEPFCERCGWREGDDDDDAYVAPMGESHSAALTPPAPAASGERCPAAKHHRMRSYQAERLIGFTDEGDALYSDRVLTSDRCTACGYDFQPAEPEGGAA